MENRQSGHESLQPLPAQWVERIFAVMSASYGSQFSDRWATANLGEVKALWSQQLAGYSPSEIKRGLDSLGEFPPSLPSFKLLCRPKPHPEAAHAEAVRLIGRLEGWTDCAIFWAAREIGSHDLKALPYEKIRGRWIEALERHWKDRKAIPLPEPVSGLVGRSGEPQRVLSEAEREDVMRRIREFGKNLKKPPKVEPLNADDLEAIQRAEAEIAARDAK